MVELRKRKAPEATSLPPAKKSSNPIKKALSSIKDAVSGGSDAPATNGSAKIAVGHKIDLAAFGGEVETHAGEKVTLAKLLDQSPNGVVLFTYPKASTPGCTTQACLFRDNYSSISAPGLSLYGLSADSLKSNTNFAAKQSLPFPLLCDPHASLIGAIGMKKAPKSTSRGVVIIDKTGTVRVWEQAGPQKTVDAVMAYVQSSGSAAPAAAATGSAARSAPAPADTTMAKAPAVAATEESEAAPIIGASTAAKTKDVSSMEAAPAAPTAHPSASSMETHPATTEQPPKMDEVPLITEPSAEEAKAAETAAEVSETAAKIDAVEETKT